MSRAQIILATKVEIRRLTKCIERLRTADAALINTAMDVFESPKGAAEWLVSPTSVWAGLGGKAPIDIASTRIGRAKVLQLLGRIAHGIPP